MSKGKTNYKIELKISPESAIAIVDSFLSAHGFAPKQENGEHWFERNDIAVGRFCFEYTVTSNPDIMNIYAYIGSHKKPYMLDNGLNSAIAKSAYKDMLKGLLSQLDNAQQPVPDSYQNDQYHTQTQEQIPYIQADSFADEVDKKNEKMTIIGFVMSIAELLLSFLGVNFGLILIILEFYFAVKGLKTNKKGLAIATFVLAVISIIITLIKIITA